MGIYPIVWDSRFDRRLKCAEAKGSTFTLQCKLGGITTAPMDTEHLALLNRIADALERLAPHKSVDADFSGARLFRHDAQSGVFVPAPDYPLALDLLGTKFSKNWDGVSTKSMTVLVPAYTLKGELVTIP